MAGSSQRSDAGGAIDGVSGLCCGLVIRKGGDRLRRTFQIELIRRDDRLKVAIRIRGQRTAL